VTNKQTKKTKTQKHKQTENGNGNGKRKTEKEKRKTDKNENENNSINNIYFQKCHTLPDKLDKSCSARNKNCLICSLSVLTIKIHKIS
jgi:hypothetical protein